MTTGRIDYAPDYKSEPRRDSKGLPIDDRGWPIMQVVDFDAVAEKAKREARAQRDVERARLERELIEAAKKWREGNWPATKISDAVDALIEFESLQEKKG